MEISEANAVGIQHAENGVFAVGRDISQTLRQHTAATICNASIHANENTKNATQKRVLSFLKARWHVPQAVRQSCLSLSHLSFKVASFANLQ
ncbi:MAG: hypothetical protein ACLS6O_04030 [Bifidobacterium sp.]